MTPLTSIFPFPYSYSKREKDQLKIVVCLYWQEPVLVLSFLLRLVWHLYFVQPHYHKLTQRILSSLWKLFHVFVRLAGIVTHAYFQERTYAVHKRDLLDSTIASYPDFSKNC